jgi:hypothetical protein
MADEIWEFEIELDDGETIVPFKKTGKNKYKSPSGRTFTKKQVALYYATDGFSKKKKKKRK